MYIPGSRVLMFPEWPVLKARFISCCYHCLPGVSKLEQVLKRAMHEDQVSNVHLIRAELGKVRWETTPGRQWGLFRSGGSGSVGDKSGHPVPSSLWPHYHSFTHGTTAARVPGFTPPPQWLLGQPLPSCGAWVLAMSFLLLFIFPNYCGWPTKSRLLPWLLATGFLSLTSSLVGTQADCYGSSLCYSLLCFGPCCRFSVTSLERLFYT